MWLAIVVVIGVLPGCTGTVDPGTGDTATGPGEVTLAGAVQKGPFVLGSSVAVSLVDVGGDLTGEVFNTSTTNDLGEFEIDFSHRGYVSLEAQGYYYNEVTGRLSDSNLTLRAYASVASGGAQSTYVNLFTHLVYERVRALVDAGTPIADAVAQAESELVGGLGIGPAGFDPGVEATEMNVLGGDTDANAYLFALSTVLAQAGALEAGSNGSEDAELQELINTVSYDLAGDGVVSDATVLLLADAETAVDTRAVVEALRDRLEDVGSDAEIPGLDRFIDSDGDGWMNAEDNCRIVSNPDQDEISGLCDWRAGASVDLGVHASGPVLAAGDLDGDGDDDLVVFLEGDLLTFLSDGGDLVGAGTLAAGAWAGVLTLADFDGDGNLDVIYAGSASDSSGDAVYVAYGAGDGTLTGPFGGTFSSENGTQGIDVGDLDGNGVTDIVLAWLTPVAFLFESDGSSNIVEVTGSPYPNDVAVVDWDGDGALDVVAAWLNGGLSVFAGDGRGGFAAGATLHDDTSATAIIECDVDGNGVPDLYAGGSDYTFLLGDGVGGVAASVDVPYPVSYMHDLDDDGMDDYLSSFDMEIRLGFSEGTSFTGISALPGEYGPAFGAGDLGGAAESQILAYYGNSGMLTVLHVNEHTD